MKDTAPVPLQKKKKQLGNWELFWRDQGDMKTKCNTQSLISYWIKKKRALEYMEECEYGLYFK